MDGAIQNGVYGSYKKLTIEIIKKEDLINETSRCILEIYDPLNEEQEIIKKKGKWNFSDDKIYLIFDYYDSTGISIELTEKWVIMKLTKKELILEAGTIREEWKKIE
jgi:hypothetical protein